MDSPFWAEKGRQNLLCSCKKKGEDARFMKARRPPWTLTQKPVIGELGNLT